MLEGERTSGANTGGWGHCSIISGIWENASLPASVNACVMSLFSTTAGTESENYQNKPRQTADPVGGFRKVLENLFPSPTESMPILLMRFSRSSLHLLNCGILYAFNSIPLPHIKLKCRVKNVREIWTWRFEKQFPFEFSSSRPPCHSHLEILKKSSSRERKWNEMKMTILRLERVASKNETKICFDNFCRVRFFCGNDERVKVRGEQPDFHTWRSFSSRGFLLRLALNFHFLITGSQQSFERYLVKFACFCMHLAGCSVLVWNFLRLRFPEFWGWRRVFGSSLLR